jgi:hypothetical protein
MIEYPCGKSMQGEEMKHLKMLGAAAAAAVALMALLGGSTASATVLCKTETNPCSAVYPAVTTEFKADLASAQSIFELADEEHLEFSRCSKETFTASISNAGSWFSTVVAPVTALEFSECVGFTKSVTIGSLEVHSIAETNDGTVTVSELEITVNLAGVDCKWRATNADLGILEGGSDPTLKINLVLARNSACYPESLGRWTATFTFTSPIYVEPS